MANVNPPEKPVSYEPASKKHTHFFSKYSFLQTDDEAKRIEVTAEFQRRLEANQGEIFVFIGMGDDESPGLSDDDFNKSVQIFQQIVEAQNSTATELKRQKAEAGLVAVFLVRQNAKENDFSDVRVAVVGNVDAGKSTLLGVLTHGEMDNGRGLARQRLFRHKHEVESGRTSSVSNDILGFDNCGNVVNRPVHGHLDWVSICEKACKVVTFIDLAGHERYLKTTIFGMTGHAPDFAMLMIGANAGVIGMTEEHLSLALALNVPVFLVVTKIDMCPKNVIQETMKMVKKLLKSSAVRKLPLVVNNEDDVVCSATNFVSERICPVFCVSNVTGENIYLLKMFMNLLHSRSLPRLDEPAEFQIDEIFQVPGVGSVVSGTCLKGVIRINDVLLLGPDTTGKFISVSIRSIHRKRMPVKEVRGGQTASFSLRKIKRNQVRKGMIMLSSQTTPRPTWEFLADLVILHHPTTISVRYQAMVHVGSVRQTAAIISMNAEHLRTGDRAHVRFRFIKNPEFFHVGARLVFREGKTKAVGTVLETYPDIIAEPQNTRSRNNAHRA